MFTRQRTGSVLCPNCGSLVGVNDAQCLSCGRRRPGLWGFTPVVRRLGLDIDVSKLIIGLSVALYLLSLLLTMRLTGQQLPYSPAFVSLRLLGASGAVPVFIEGRWWTLLSAGWLHAGVLHILFNMMWVRQLVPSTAELYGSARLVILYTLAGVAGFAASACAGYWLAGMPIPVLRGGTFTVGASAPIFGLLGAQVYYGRRGGSSLIRGQALGYALIMGLFGLIMPGVDNYAHAGGFAGGYLLGRWLDPLLPERTDHMFAALGCAIATLGAIALSLFQGLRVLF